MRCLIFLSLVGVASCLFGIGWKQSVAIRGMFVCNGHPAEGVKLKLYDDEIFVDYLMAEMHTMPDGSFNILGQASEITDIDPRLNVYHRCNYEGPCYKKFKITVPDKFITTGKVPNMAFDMGRIELQVVPDQSTDCIN